MKTAAVLVILASAMGAVADRYYSCGHMLVNDPSHQWSQSSIAQAACGRTDTCDGKEWNTLFEVLRKSSGPAEWTEIVSTGVFCHLGCWGTVGRFDGQCH